MSSFLCSGIPGIEPLDKRKVISDKKTNGKKMEKYSAQKSFLNTTGINKDSEIQLQDVLRLSVDNVSVTSHLSQKRRLSMSQVVATGDQDAGQLTPKKSKVNIDGLEEVSVNSLSLPRRKFLNTQCIGLKSPTTVKLHSDYNSQSHQDYPLTQKVCDSQTYVHHSPESVSPFRLRNMSPIMFGSETGSIGNASVTSESKKKLGTIPVPKLSQQLSSQHNMFAGMSPQRSQLGPDFPVTPHSSQKLQKIQPTKKFVAGF